MLFRYLFILFISIFTLFFTSCDSIFLDNENNDPQLPPITMTGENTFGCLVNGEVFLPKGGSLATIGNNSNPRIKLEEASGGFLLSASNSDFEFSFALLGEKAVFSTEEMALSSFSAYQTFDDIDTCMNYYAIPISSYLNIAFLDTENDIISGIFHGKFLDPCGDTIHITEGRFDGEYTK